MLLSIIVCSRNKAPLPEFIFYVEQTVGIDYELIHIDNSENSHSIFSAYNEGFRQSKGDCVCFIHEDVKFHTKNWGEKLLSHLQVPSAGIVGMAGGGIVLQVPDSWKNKQSFVNIIQSGLRSKKTSRKVILPKGNTEIRREVILLDGVFLAMTREVASAVCFDESLQGFHGYDIDICLQAYTAGYKNFVVYDIALEHFSRGKRDNKYFRNLIAIFHKWEKSLPLWLDNVHIKVSTEHTSRLYRLLYKLVSRRFTKNEVVENITYFAKKSNTAGLLQYQRVVAVYYTFIRTFLFIKNLFH